jgi:class 3 adenylate cyclase
MVADINLEDSDIFGDGANVAARLEGSDRWRPAVLLVRPDKNAPECPV